MKNKLTQFTKPAIVIGGGINALGVVRSLGAAGVPVIVVDDDKTSPAMRSRYGRKLLAPALEGSLLIGYLQQLAGELGGPAMLFLTEEKAVNTVSERRGELPLALLIRLPEHQRLMALMHKQGFQELAEAHGAPVPRTARMEGMQDLEKVAALRFPCILKPSKKSYTYGARFKKAYKVSSVSEVAALYQEIEPVLADMVVQEWIEGSDAEIYFCMQYIGGDGVVAASFTGRKIRSWPPHVGGTASCTAAWEEATELNEITSAFFKQVGFAGMGSMEYKRDARDGRFYMVEPTVARTDFQEEVATVNGCNLPYAAYCYEFGLPLPTIEPMTPPRIWRDARTDRWSLEESAGVPDQRSQGQAVMDSYWRLNDPLPWLSYMCERIVQGLRRKT